MQQWCVGNVRCIIDTVKHLTMRIDSSPEQFFNDILLAMPECTQSGQCAGYASLWQKLAGDAAAWHAQYVNDAPWCDLKAFSLIMHNLPANCTLHLSNGTCIRYAQLFGTQCHIPCYCNRGTSGIDGSTSTALGTSLVAPGDETTLLITGDMSFGYDLAGIASQYVSRRFKIIVMCNGGGNIFRFLNGTSELPELEEYFEVSRTTRIQALASAFGFDYFEATDAETLSATIGRFYESTQQAILAIHTPARENAAILRRYFRM